MSKIKSISVSVYDKASGETKKAFLELNLQTANLFDKASKFGSQGLKDITIESVQIGDKEVNKVTGFKIANDKESSTSVIHLEKIKFEFLKKDGDINNADDKYEVVKKINKTSGKELNQKTQDLLNDLATVVTAGFRGNKGKTHTDADFYKGEVNVFTGSQYETVVDGKTKVAFEPVEGATKVTNIDKVDPRQVKIAKEFIAALDAKEPKVVETPEVKEEEVGGIDR